MGKGNNMHKTKNRKNITWDKDKILFLKENYPKMSRKELARKMGVTEASVKSALQRYNIKRYVYALE
jgi:DNA-binding MarR family transcriptional regulator